MKNFLYGVITGKDKSLIAKMVHGVLYVLSGGYYFGISLWDLFSDLGLVSARSLGLPTVSVGNITMGGVGKTPFVIYIARCVSARNRCPVVLTRGYMLKEGEESDEALMMQHALKGVGVYADPDRFEASKLALAGARKPDVFILDDGFQHRKVERDMDIVLLDATNPFGNGCLLPAGILREPIEAAARADVFVLSKVDQAPQEAVMLRGELNRLNPNAIIVETAHVPVGVQVLRAGHWIKGPFEELKGKKVVACSAIGSPQSFEFLLAQSGATLLSHKVFMDHHSYSAKDLEKVLVLAQNKGADLIVTTQKDAVKIMRYHHMFEGITLMVLIMDIRIIRGEHEFISRLDRLLID